MSDIKEDLIVQMYFSTGSIERTALVFNISEDKVIRILNDSLYRLMEGDVRNV